MRYRDERCAYDLIVVDSVGMFAFDAVLEGDASQQHVGLEARKNSTWIRKMVPLLRKYGATLLLINHVSMKIGTMFGNPETMPGGMKLRYAASIEVHFDAPEREPKETDKEITAYTYKMRANKNKTAPPQRKAHMRVHKVDGLWAVDISREIALLAKGYGFIQNKSGQNWEGGHMFYQGDLIQYPTAGGMKPVMSEKSFMEALDDNPDLRAKLEQDIRVAIAAESVRGAVVPKDLDAVEPGEVLHDDGGEDEESDAD